MAIKVLLADDEAAIVRIAEMNLQRRGYAVITASDGQQALEKARTERPDVIVLDIMMPVMDGFEALRRLKADPDTAAIPVIVLTAQAKNADILQAQEMGAEHYLTKPFNPLELLRLLGEVLGTTPEAGR